MLKEIKKWNWNVFMITFLVALIGSMTNKSVPTIIDAIVAAISFGMPLGLIWAYLTKKN